MYDSLVLLIKAFGIFSALLLLGAFLRAVAHYHYFVELVVVLAHLDFHLWLALEQDGLVAEIGDAYLRAVRGFEGELAVGVCHRAVGSAVLKHRRTNHRLALVVDDRARHRQGILVNALRVGMYRDGSNRQKAKRQQ